SPKERDNNSTALIIFGSQLALNVLWTFVFFGLQLFFAGLIEILVLWGAIALTIITSYRVNKTAGLILVPYIAWVTIATLLNYYVWILNP
ncbi:MAG: tryptophan-rich sensory protein, partial [Thaumarchaeota archaeon]|nr:tryptophan-rich sensory protein [Nitrososphaerota archaeon]